MLAIFLKSKTCFFESAAQPYFQKNKSWILFDSRSLESPTVKEVHFIEVLLED